MMIPDNVRHIPEPDQGAFVGTLNWSNGILTIYNRGVSMKPIKDFLCDKTHPTDEEILECINIANAENCVVKLRWFAPYNGQHWLLIEPGMSFEECKAIVPKRYGV